MTETLGASQKRTICSIEECYSCWGWSTQNKGWPIDSDEAIVPRERKWNWSSKTRNHWKTRELKLKTQSPNKKFWTESGWCQSGLKLMVGSNNWSWAIYRAK